MCFITFSRACTLCLPNEHDCVYQLSPNEGCASFAAGRRSGGRLAACRRSQLREGAILIVRLDKTSDKGACCRVGSRGWRGSGRGARCRSRRAGQPSPWSSRWLSRRGRRRRRGGRDRLGPLELPFRGSGFFLVCTTCVCVGGCIFGGCGTLLLETLCTRMRSLT